ncbi:MAG: carbohydrate esterase family 4 protein [Benniella sp.]|nr:MAG: carbohydrate esterase family 4 protein [Benniella sp.]
MVKVFASLSVFVLTIAAVKAQTINMADYPKPNEVPDTKSAQVQAWLKEIDLTGAPTTPLAKAPKGSPPECPATPGDACIWTCTGCAGEDILECGAPGTWGLTFDDGPSTATPQLLDFLKTNKLSASFFLIGSNVIQFPATVKRELQEGHHLASHTWSHTALTTLTNEQIVAEMKWTEKAVLEATGVRMKYMRPPYGDINNRVRFVLKKMGYIPVDWTGDQFDTNDWRIGTTGWDLTKVVSTFSTNLDAYVGKLTANANQAGFYCLEHDVSQTTVTAALQLIPLGLKKNIKFANVGDCQKDASPYQSGSSPANPTTPANATTPSGAKPSASSSHAPTNGPNVIGAGSHQAASAGLISALAIGVAGALLA